MRQSSKMISRKKAPRLSKGNALVELAIIMPLILLITIGLIEFSQAYMQLNSLNKSVRDGMSYLSRVAVNNTNTATLTDFGSTEQRVVDMVSKTKTLIKDNFHATALSSVILEDNDIVFAAEDTDHVRITVTYCHPLLLGDLLSLVSGFFGASLDFNHCNASNQIPFNVTGIYRVV